MQPSATSQGVSEGMPIYPDQHVRGIVDSLEQPSTSKDWHPANALSIKLWQCLEALRDIDIALENAGSQKNATKRKRQLKQFSVQLHSLAKCVVRLCDHIVGDPDANRWLTHGSTAQVSKIKTEFLDMVPIEPKGELSILRNRLGGHIDDKLSPWSAEEILSREAISSFGRWLHVCLHALLDLMKLDVYSWSVHPEIPGTIRLMANEPFLVTFIVDEEIKHIVALHLSKRSPRQAIVEVIDRVVKQSQWMFNPGEPRIGALNAGHQDAWNTFSGSHSIWDEASSGSAT